MRSSKVVPNVLEAFDDLGQKARLVELADGVVEVNFSRTSRMFALKPEM
jgi:hypothetical protein